MKNVPQWQKFSLRYRVNGQPWATPLGRYPRQVVFTAQGERALRARAKALFHWQFGPGRQL